MELKARIYDILMQDERWLTKRQLASKLGYSNPYLHAVATQYLEKLVSEGKVVKRYTESLYQGHGVWMYKVSQS